MINENTENIVTADEGGIAKEEQAKEGAINEASPDTDKLSSETESADYAELLRSDMNELTKEFSANETIKITDLKNPIRYGALRDLGLSPKEAYLASGGRKERVDNRAHLSSSVPRKMAASFSEIPKAELDTAREIFTDMSDSEIKNLYRKVTQ